MSNNILILVIIGMLYVAITMATHDYETRDVER